MTGDAAGRRAMAGAATAAPRAVLARVKRVASLVSCIAGVLGWEVELEKIRESVCGGEEETLWFK